MDVKRVTKELKERYPDKKIILNTPDDPLEIICEIEPEKDRSVAIAVVDKIEPHYHEKTTEVYKILKGELEFFLDDNRFILKEGEKIKIEPGDVHWGYGDETWFKITSKPGWSPSDHFLVSDNQ